MTIKRMFAVVIIACVFVFTMYFVLEITGVTERVTGLEAAQVNDEIRVAWDDMDCDGYFLAIFDKDGLVEKANVTDEQYIMEGAEAEKEYKIQVAGRDEDGDYSQEDTTVIETKKLQGLKISCSEGDIFTSDEFEISAESDSKANISYRSSNQEIASVGKNGKVTINENGKTEITVTADETEEFAAAEAVVSLNAGESYEGKMPEMPNAIVSEAFKCAWPYGTARSVYKYGGGTSTAHFKEAIDRVYPDHNHWGGTQPGKGASCDVFVGTVVRASGYDSNFPRALKGDYSYLPKSDKFTRVSASEIQPGDIMLRRGHIQIYVEDENGTGYIANAHFKLKTYGIIEKKNPRLSGYAIYHPNGDCTAPLSEGETGNDVMQAQEFLSWAGYYDKKVDGKYGSNFTKAVKKFQKASGIDETGNFGSTCVSKAKKYTRNSVDIEMH